jgi:hypothetical protein
VTTAAVPRKPSGTGPQARLDQVEPATPAPAIVVG